MSNLKVTMLIDVESKTLGKVTLTLVIIMFHGATLQRNMATLRTECLVDPFTAGVPILRLSSSQEFAVKDKNR